MVVETNQTSCLKACWQAERLANDNIPTKRVDTLVAISLDVGSIPTVSTNTYVGGFCLLIKNFLMF